MKAPYLAIMDMGFELSADISFYVIIIAWRHQGRHGTFAEPMMEVKQGHTDK